MFRDLNEKEVKVLFRQLAHYLHPDKGGDPVLFDKLINARDMRISEIKNTTKKGSAESKHGKTPKYTYEEMCEKDTEERKIYDGELKEGEFPKETIEDKIWDTDPRLKIFNYIFEYHSIHPEFKLDFTLSVQSYIFAHEYCTSTQYNSLVKVYYSFKMKERIEKHRLMKKKENHED